MSRHLADLAAALVDGELDHAARERAFSHVARCAPCREEVDAQRRLKARLAGLRDPQPPPGLVDRLAQLGSAVPDGTPAGGSWSRSFEDVVGPAAFDAPDGAGRTDSDAVFAGRRGTPRAGATRPFSGGPPRAARGVRRPPRAARPVSSFRVRRALAGGASLLVLTVGVMTALGGATGGSAVPVDPAGDAFVVEHAATTGEMPLTDPAVGAAVTVSYGR